MTDPSTPNPPKDAFSTLELPARFALEPAAIETAYLKQAAGAHPDLSGLDASEAARLSSRLNKAKQTLLDDESRANTMLARLGGPSASDQKTLPDGFLMDIMRTRQQIEADLAANNNRAHWEQWARQRRAEMIGRVAALFEAAQTDPAVLGQIRTQLNAWRYLERLAEQLDPGYDPAKADF